MFLIKILAVEDDEFNSKSFFRILKVIYTDIAIKVAKDYDEAMDLYTNEDFDVLLVDLDLRGSVKQGWDFISEIRAEDDDITIYVLTGIEYEGVISEKEFTDKYKIKKWIKKPLPARKLYEYLINDFNLKNS